MSSPAASGEGALARLLGLVPPPPPPPAVDLDLLVEEARAEGFAAAMELSQARVEELEAAHRLALAAAEATSAARIDAVAAELAGAARALARAVLRAEPLVPEAALAALVRDVIEAAGQRGMLRLHPDDRARLEGALPEGWQAVADPSVPSGEVRGECTSGLFLAGLSRRAEALLGPEVAP